MTAHDGYGWDAFFTPLKIGKRLAYERAMSMSFLMTDQISARNV